MSDVTSEEEQDPTIRFEIDGKKYEVNLAELTFDEAEWLEEEMDVPFGAINLESVKFLRRVWAVAVARKKRIALGEAFLQTAGNVSLKKLSHIAEADGEEESPTKAGSASSKSKTRSSRGSTASSRGSSGD